MAPKDWDTSKFQKLVEELQESAAVSKTLLKDAGGDQATLSRVYTIQHEDIEKVKTFPGARSLAALLENAMTHPDFRANWDTLPIQREKKDLPISKLFTSSRYSENGAAIVKELEKTQLGQALKWLKTIPEWSYRDNEKRPDEVQYVVIGGLLSDASKSANPLPGKFMNPDVVAERVEEYYPMIFSVLDRYSYNTSGNLGMEIVRYAAWKDSTTPVPFLANVTALPVSEEKIEVSPAPVPGPSPTF